MFSYNPRIAILMNKLEAGTIYDRKGLVLATSNPDLIGKQKALLNNAGAGNYDLDSAMHKRLTRYYPLPGSAVLLASGRCQYDGVRWRNKRVFC